MGDAIYLAYQRWLNKSNEKVLKEPIHSKQADYRQAFFEGGVNDYRTARYK